MSTPVIPATPEDSLAAFVAALQSLKPQDLKAIIDRRHPDYEEYSLQWEFMERTYKGGRDWFLGNVFKYIKEGDIEYSERVARAYRFNHTREVVDLVNKYIFKGDICRKDTEASEHVQEFWKSATLSRKPITDFMKLVSKSSSTFGRIWVCTDTNQTNPNATLLAQRQAGARVYGYVIKPQNVLDLAYDKNGDLIWVKVREFVRDDDSILDDGEVNTQFRLWTQEFWVLFTEVENVQSKEIEYEVKDWGVHNLGRVPIFPVDHNPTDSHYVSPGLIDDIAYLDRAVANYLSNLDSIIQDQTFSQLIMPAQGMLPGDDSQTKLLEMGTKRIFTYDAQAQQAPQYISPDASNAQVIMEVINKIISEIYHSIGMAGERTKQDNSMGIDNSSGVAKAYDFDRMNAMLASKARSLELAENTLCEMVDTWFGDASIVPGSYDLVQYPDNFDVRGLSDEIDLAQSLLLIQAPDQVRQQQMMTVVDKLFPNLAEDLIAAMKKEILADWPPEPPPTPATAPAANVKESKQGQVTKVTGTLTAQ